MRFYTKNLIMISVIFFQSCCALDMTLSQVLDQYQQALKSLILAQGSTSKTQDALSDPLILSTYQKLITPSVFWINGYAKVLASEFACKFPYYQDLTSLTLEYAKHEKGVEKIIQLLPTSAQAQALEIFHASVAKIVLPVCFNIVQQIANQNTVNQADRTAAYQAYSLAYKLQTKNLAAALANEFAMTMTPNMITLFSNAINILQTSLSSNLSSGVLVEPVYQKLKECYQVLSQVYLNSGDTTNAQYQQNSLQALYAQEKSYALAQTQQQQAATALQAAYNPVIVLDVKNVATVVANIAASNTNLSSAFTLNTSAQASFALAQDLMGQTNCATINLRIGNFDMMLRAVQDLWGLYLTDQSESQIVTPFYSFPTLQQFVTNTGASAGQSANAVQSLQNLVGMCSAQYGYTNNIGPLFSATYNALLLPILQNLLLFAEQNLNLTKNIDPLFDPQLLVEVQKDLQILVSMCNCMINAVNNSDQTQIAPAMTYAQILDGLWIKNKNLNQYIPYLPDSLQSDTSLALDLTWVNFAAQFFYQAQIVTTAAQARALAGKGKVTLPVQLSTQDLSAMKKTAQTLFSHAQALENSDNFAAASPLYEQAMNLYQKLYLKESFGSQQIAMLNLANLAKTRFVATNFSSVVQSSGSVAFGKVQNIPTSYVATSYQLSFDPTIMGSVMPACLTALTPPQTLTSFVAQDQADLFAFIKGYIVAQKLTDQGMIGDNIGTSFTNYFTDYTMSSVVQASGRAQAAIVQISNYLNNFANMSITSVTLESATQVTLLLTNFPLAALTPPCTTLSTAGTFYGAAATLFAPGTAPLSLGGQIYDPGNDVSSQKVMLKKLGYAYLSQAQAKNIKFASLIQKLSTELGITATGATAQTLPQGFSTKFNEIQNMAIAIQALLYGQEINTAYGCFMQAGATTLAQKVKDEFINLYKIQIDFSKHCLIGDPTSSQYLSIVTAINQAYLNWAAELTSTTDAALIDHINTQISALFELAGKQCLNYSFSLPEFPKSASQIHYMVASQYYYSAQLQYQKLNNDAQVQILATMINQMYYQSAVQNLQLYCDVKKYGAMYTSVSTQEVNPITFVQLLSDFNSESAGSGESKLYRQVQHLLFDAAMVFEYLSNGTPNPLVTSAHAATPATPVQTVIDPNHTTILQFLGKQNLLDSSKIQYFSEIPLGLTEKIIKLATGPYTVLSNNLNFNTQPAVFQAWNALLFSMVKNLYNVDYQAVSDTSTPTQVELATQQFLSSISNEASRLQNPSSAYIG